MAGRHARPRVATPARRASGRRRCWSAGAARSRRCAEALLDAGLPVEVVGLGGLLMTPEVVDVVATLRVLADHAPGRAGPAARRRPVANRARRPRRAAAAGPAGWPGSAPSRSTGRSRRTRRTDPGSLVEALDDLGSPAATPPTGTAGWRRSRRELRELRQRLSGPLPELVADVEQTIGVGVEVAARADRARVGRAHLDRFLDEAAQFAADADEATLTAFLAYLDAAEDEENGLEAGEVVVEAERVQMLTVHGAKGLEWDLVAVPGLVEKVFPAEPKAVNWTTDAPAAADTAARRPRSTCRSSSCTARRPQAARAMALDRARRRWYGTASHRGAAAGLRRRHPGPLDCCSPPDTPGTTPRSRAQPSAVPRRDPRPGRGRRAGSEPEDGAANPRLSRVRRGGRGRSIRSATGAPTSRPARSWCGRPGCGPTGLRPPARRPPLPGLLRRPARSGGGVAT